MGGIKHTSKNYQMVCVLLAIACLHDILLTKIFTYYNINIEYSAKDYGFATNVIAGLIIAPLLETIIFQYLPFKGLRYFKLTSNEKSFRWAYLVCSTSLFCLSHSYSTVYIIAMILPGLLLAYYFNFYHSKFNFSTAIYFITLLHFSKNTIVLVDKYLIN